MIPLELERTATAEQRRAAILHELVHVQRSDPAWNLLLRVVEAVYWFHPLMWLLSRSIAATRELVCDSVCAQHLGTESYSGALIELAGRLKRSPRLTLGLAMARTSRLGRRLEALRRAGPRLRSRLRPAQAAAIAVPVAVLVLGSASIRLVAAVAPPASNQAESPEVPVVLAGRLIDAQGEPFGEIELQVEIENWVPGPGEDKTSERRLKTDREGRFSLEFVPEPRPEGTTVFRFHSDGFMAYGTGGWSPAELRQATLGDLITQRRFRKQGRILDPDGQPIAGARVFAVPEVDKESQHEDSEHLFERVEADRSGRFAVHLPRERTVGLIVRSDRGALRGCWFPRGKSSPRDPAPARHGPRRKGPRPERAAGAGLCCDRGEQRP